MICSQNSVCTTIENAIILLSIIDEFHLEQVQNLAFKSGGYQSVLMSILHSIVHTPVIEWHGEMVVKRWSNIQQLCQRWLQRSLLLEETLEELPLTKPKNDK